MNPDAFRLLYSLPVLCISGYSGSGKTTLVEALIPKLIQQGLRVGVVKHDAHRLEVDRPGKDSDRFFKAGADVYMHSSSENFSRQHAGEHHSLVQVLLRLCREYDLILVEGYKHTPLQKIWLLGDGENAPPHDVSGILSVLSRNSNRVEQVESFIESWLPKQWLQTPVNACLLLDIEPAASFSIDLPEKISGFLESLEFCFQRLIVVSRAPSLSLGQYPHLPCMANENWTLNAISTAMRWDPFAAVVVLREQDLSRGAAIVQKMITERRPGCWTIGENKNGGDGFSIPAYFDFRFLSSFSVL